LSHNKHNHPEPNLKKYININNGTPFDKEANGQREGGNRTTLMGAALLLQQATALGLIRRTNLGTNSPGELLLKPKVRLEDQVLWRKFQSITNEMIISKKGRSVLHLISFLSQFSICFVSMSLF
jgi:hypothetical protein